MYELRDVYYVYTIIIVYRYNKYKINSVDEKSTSNYRKTINKKKIFLPNVIMDFPSTSHAIQNSSTTSLCIMWAGKILQT